MINAVIYGIGRWGSTLVRSVQDKSDKIRFAAAITRDPGAHKDFAGETGLDLSNDFAAVLADPGIDAAVLASPPWLHLDHIRLAAAAGKPVFVEKPLALDPQQAATAVEICKTAGVPLAVGFNRRFLPAFADMRQRIAAGDIGDLLHLEARFNGPTYLRPMADVWRAERQYNPAGGMVPRGLHSLDALIALGGPVGSVFALSERRVTALDLDDTTSMLFSFTNGISGYLSTIMATGELWHVQAHGTRGRIEMLGENSLTLSDLGQVTDRKTYDPIDMERTELDAFADLVSDGTPFPVPASEAAHGIAVLAAIDRSATSGAQVMVSDR